MQRLDWQQSSDPHRRTARTDGSGVVELTVFSLTESGPPAVWRGPKPGDDAPGIEAGAVVLTGCHDLRAGSGTWASRGIREQPGQGKPVAVYLPPGIEFAAANGNGEILIAAAAQPQRTADDQPPPEPATKPLLPLAGSNKAYNPATGTWDPIESFPDSPEAVPPRKMPATERISGAAPWIEVFPTMFKAATLSVAESLLPADAPLTLPQDGVLNGTDVDDWLLYIRPLDGGEAIATATDGTSETITGDAVVHATRGDSVVVRCSTDCYLLLATAGKSTG